MMSLMMWWLMWLSYRQGFAMKMGWNEELEFCDEEWKKFVADKIEIDSKCKNTHARCCVEEKKYLLEQFKMFSELCLLEGKVNFNFTVQNINWLCTLQTITNNLHLESGSWPRVLYKLIKVGLYALNMSKYLTYLDTLASMH